LTLSVTVANHHAPDSPAEWMTGSGAFGLPSGITRNLANTTTPNDQHHRGYR